MNEKRMKDRVRKFYLRTRGVLRGYRLAFNKKPDKPDHSEEGFANIVKDKNSHVEGVVYLILESSLQVLDECEGVKYNHYKRVVVDVMLDDGTEIKAFTYIAHPSKIQEGLKPTRKYLSHLLKGKDVLSKEWYEKLQQLETVG